MSNDKPTVLEAVGQVNGFVMNQGETENWQKVAGYIHDKIGAYDSANDDPHKVLSEITDIIETAFGHMPSALEKMSATEDS